MRCRPHRHVAHELSSVASPLLLVHQCCPPLLEVLLLLQLGLLSLWKLMWPFLAVALQAQLLLA